MTLLIVGSYRGPALVQRALKSLAQNLTGVTELVIVDDSGDASVSATLRVYGEVIEVGGRGYNAAMKAVTARAGHQSFMFWEEDFTLTEKVDLQSLTVALDARPHLAQLALLRQAWFPIERKAGGLIPALRARGFQVELINGVWEQRATFTCNPALWRAGVASSGWPDGDWSEDAKRDQLIAQGFSFGFLDGIKVTHDGERSGHGY